MSRDSWRPRGELPAMMPVSHGTLNRPTVATPVDRSGWRLAHVRQTIGYEILHNLIVPRLRGGTVYPVNPKASVRFTLSYAATRSSEFAIPDPVDLAVIVVPQKAR